MSSPDFFYMEKSILKNREETFILNDSNEFVKNDENGLSTIIPTGTKKTQYLQQQHSINNKQSLR